MDCLDCKYSPKQPFNKKSPGEKGTNNSSFSLPVNVLENDAAKLQQEGKRRSLQCLAQKKAPEEQEDEKLLQRSWWSQP